MVTKNMKKPTAKTTRTKTVDDYLAAAPKDERAALTKLRKTVKAAAPKATESLSYGIVGFKHKGKRLVYFGYWKSHCALYGMGNGVYDAYAAELKDYDLTKGTIKFPADRPLPDRLVTRMLKTRIAEIEKDGVSNER
jgi:uncharacterized protein YdhG (YjbR/CyaY superfamily)